MTSVFCIFIWNPHSLTLVITSLLIDAKSVGKIFCKNNQPFFRPNSSIYLEPFFFFLFIVSADLFPGKREVSTASALTCQLTRQLKCNPVLQQFPWQLGSFAHRCVSGAQSSLPALTLLIPYEILRKVRGLLFLCLGFNRHSLSLKKNKGVFDVAHHGASLGWLRYKFWSYSRVRAYSTIFLLPPACIQIMFVRVWA